MIEKIIRCDICEKSGAKQYRYISGSEMDPSGNGYNTCYEYIDLCWGHFKEWICDKDNEKYAKSIREINEL